MTGRHCGWVFLKDGWSCSPKIDATHLPAGGGYPPLSDLPPLKTVEEAKKIRNTTMEDMVNGRLALVMQPVTPPPNQLVTDSLLMVRFQASTVHLDHSEVGPEKGFGSTNPC